jgi:hypothetical protein
MIEDMRKYVRAGLDALSSQGAEDAAGVIMSRATVLADQLNAFASGFLECSAAARASLMQELKDMITRQVDSMGLATKEDLQALGRRIDRLERASKSKEPAGASKSKASAGATKSKGSTGSSKAKATARARRPKTTSRSGGSRRSTSE